MTIDYGPFGFIDAYDPNYISNASDNEGRYKFRNQPGICKWNLARLFDSILLAVPQLKEDFDEILTNYAVEYHQFYLDKMRLKLGLFQKLPQDLEFIKSLLSAMEQTSGDYTNIFRCLSRFDGNYKTVLKYILKQCKVENPDHEKIWIDWLNLYQRRLEQEEENSDRVTIMNSNNPKYILRNYLVQIAIDQATEGDFTEVNRLFELFELLKDPYDNEGKFSEFTYDRLPPGWASELCVT